jgi:ABC-type nitrate/sulfonate/bicarbonate transport system substrate-binding protein
VDGLKQMLKVAGIDPDKDLKIGPVPGFSVGQTASFGLLAAKALEEGKIDGFWANGMGAEVAVKSGIGILVLDARRDGTELMKGYTFPALVTTQRLIDENPEAAKAAVNAVVAAQKALREDPGRATAIGRKLFPPAEAEMIAELIRRDLPFYDAAISEKTVTSMNQFARDLGLLSKSVKYEDVVWNG